MEKPQSEENSNIGCMLLLWGSVALFFGWAYYDNQNNKHNNSKIDQNQAIIGVIERSPGHQAGYDWAQENDLFDHDLCTGNSDAFVEGCYEYVEEAMISAGCNEEQAWERCEFD